MHTEINKESRQNLGVREELIIRNYGFINPLSINASDPRYVSALRIAVVQLQMVQAVLEQELRLGITEVGVRILGPCSSEARISVPVADTTEIGCVVHWS